MTQHIINSRKSEKCCHCCQQSKDFTPCLKQGLTGNSGCSSLGKNVWLEKDYYSAEFFSFRAGSATLNDFAPARTEPQLYAISIHQHQGQKAGALWSLFLFYMAKDNSVQAAKTNRRPRPAHSLHSYQKMPTLPFIKLLSCVLKEEIKINK